jgi:hypothetical protein
MNFDTFFLQQWANDFDTTLHRSKISSQRIAIPAARSYGSRKARIVGSLTQNTNRRILHQ